MIYDVPALYAVMWQQAIPPDLARIMVATMLTEAPGPQPGTVNTAAVGDQGHSHGPYQMHDRGAGAGLTVGQRQDVAFATSHMYRTEFGPAFEKGRDRQYEGRELAVWTYLRAERPFGYLSEQAPGWHSPAAQRFAAVWAQTPAGQLDPPEEEPEPMADDVVSRVLHAAEAQIGTPYALPPDGVTTTDCSLFVGSSFAQAGVPFPAGVRTAEQVRLACEVVTSTDTGWDNRRVQRGDLLFFEQTYAGNPGERATHVGFALLGGQMLDANDGRGTVGYTDLRTPYWQDHLFEARRPPQYASAPAPPSPPPAPDLEARVTALEAVVSRLRAALA